MATHDRSAAVHMHRQLRPPAMAQYSAGDQKRPGHTCPFFHLPSAQPIKPPARPVGERPGCRGVPVPDGDRLARATHKPGAGQPFTPKSAFVPAKPRRAWYSLIPERETD